MKEPDSFEEKLWRQAIRPLPESWRAEILAGARAVPGVVSVSKQDAFRERSSLVRQFFRGALAEILCPGKRAWSGLATVWALILLVNFINRDTDQGAALPAAAKSQLAREILKQQAQLFAEFSGANDTSDAVEPKRNESRPRSESRVHMTAV